MPSGPLPGLVAAYGFDEGSGTTTADQAGNANTGTVANTTWSSRRQVRQGPLLQRNELLGDGQQLTSLDLTTGMTVEAWVNPTTLGNAFRTVVFREEPGNEVFSLYGNQSGSPQAPVGEVRVNGFKDATASTGLADRHVDPSGRDLRRLVRAAVRERHARLDAPQPPDRW